MIRTEDIDKASFWCMSVLTWTFFFCICRYTSAHNMRSAVDSVRLNSNGMSIIDEVARSRYVGPRTQRCDLHAALLEPVAVTEMFVLRSATPWRQDAWRVWRTSKGWHRWLLPERENNERPERHTERARHRWQASFVVSAAQMARWLVRTAGSFGTFVPRWTADHSLVEFYRRERQPVTGYSDHDNLFVLGTRWNLCTFYELVCRWDDAHECGVLDMTLRDNAPLALEDREVLLYLPDDTETLRMETCYGQDDTDALDDVVAVRDAPGWENSREQVAPLRWNNDAHGAWHEVATVVARCCRLPAALVRSTVLSYLATRALTVGTMRRWLTSVYTRPLTAQQRACFAEVAGLPVVLNRDTDCDV